MFFQAITFGCKLNQAESDMISADLISAGFIPARGRQSPDLIILNVCAVTHKAVREGRQKAAFLKRKYPQAKIIVTGCIENRDWPGVDKRVKDKNKIIKEIRKLGYWDIDYYSSAGKGLKPQKLTSHVRAFIKIQTGCDKFCAYCIVPFTRGKPVSRNPKEIIEEILAKERQGYREIALAGVNIGLYQFSILNSDKSKIKNPKLVLDLDQGSKTNSKSQILNSKHDSTATMKQWNNETMNNVDLINLLKLILRRTRVERIRLSSLWPAAVNFKLINLMAKNSRLCPHIHLSIQSGSDRILGLMGRNYTVKDILKIVNLARQKIPKINFTADIIVGFPGETKADFQDSLNLIKRIGCSKIHVFKYSLRPRTKAAVMTGQIGDNIKRDRSEILRYLADQAAIKAKHIFFGHEFNVLWENKRHGYWYGFSENYIRVKRPDQGGDLKNRITKIKVQSANLT